MAIEINELCLRFRDDNLVCVGNFDSLYSYNATSISLKDPSDVEKLTQICNICCEYNKNKTYNPVTCNGFHFVRDVLKALNILPNQSLPDNQLGSFVMLRLLQLIQIT